MPSYQTIYRKMKVGAVVRLRRQMKTTGGTILAIGLQMKITRKRGGLQLRTIGDRPCHYCGIGQIKEIHGVSALDVERIDPNEVSDASDAGKTILDAKIAEFIDHRPDFDGIFDERAGFEFLLTEFGQFLQGKSLYD